MWTKKMVSVAEHWEQHILAFHSTDEHNKKS